jgi:hypothetical protein
MGAPLTINLNRPKRQDNISLARDKRNKKRERERERERIHRF